MQLLGKPKNNQTLGKLCEFFYLKILLFYSINTIIF